MIRSRRRARRSCAGDRCRSTRGTLDAGLHVFTCRRSWNTPSPRRRGMAFRWRGYENAAPCRHRFAASLLCRAAVARTRQPGRAGSARAVLRGRHGSRRRPRDGGGTLRDARRARRRFRAGHLRWAGGAEGRGRPVAGRLGTARDRPGRRARARGEFPRPHPRVMDRARFRLRAAGRARRTGELEGRTALGDVCRCGRGDRGAVAGAAWRAGLAGRHQPGSDRRGQFGRTPPAGKPQAWS